MGPGTIIYCPHKTHRPGFLSKRGLLSRKEVLGECLDHSQFVTEKHASPVSGCHVIRFIVKFNRQEYLEEEVFPLF